MLIINIEEGGKTMKGYINPNAPTAVELGGCIITPLKIAIKALMCTAGPLAVV